jgi:hypothetical protein
MVHDPALDAHEHTEHAAHAAHGGHEPDPFMSRVTITVAALAVLAAMAGSLETVEGGRALGASSEAVLAQDKATDSWNEFQADGLKRRMYAIAADTGGAHMADYLKTAKDEGDKQTKDRAKATENETERDRLLGESSTHESRHHWLTGAATLFEIGIAMSTVAIITRRQWLWLAATAFGVGGIALLVSAYVT